VHSHRPEPPLAPPSRLLPALLPFAAPLPDAPLLPHLAFGGAPLRPQGIAIEAERYAAEFRAEVGGCAAGSPVSTGPVPELFCWGADVPADGVVLGASGVPEPAGRVGAGGSGASAAAEGPERSAAPEGGKAAEKEVEKGVKEV